MDVYISLMRELQHRLKADRLGLKGITNSGMYYLFTTHSISSTSLQGAYVSKKTVLHNKTTSKTGGEIL